MNYLLNTDLNITFYKGYFLTITEPEEQVAQNDLCRQVKLGVPEVSNSRIRGQCSEVLFKFIVQFRGSPKDGSFLCYL